MGPPSLAALKAIDAVAHHSSKVHHQEWVFDGKGIRPEVIEVQSPTFIVRVVVECS